MNIIYHQVMLATPIECTKNESGNARLKDDQIILNNKLIFDQVKISIPVYDKFSKKPLIGSKNKNSEMKKTDGIIGDDKNDGNVSLLRKDSNLYKLPMTILRNIVDLKKYTTELNDENSNTYSTYSENKENGIFSSESKSSTYNVCWEEMKILIKYLKETTKLIEMKKIVKSDHLVDNSKNIVLHSSIPTLCWDRLCCRRSVYFPFRDQLSGVVDRGSTNSMVDVQLFYGVFPVKKNSEILLLQSIAANMKMKKNTRNNMKYYPQNTQEKKLHTPKFISRRKNSQRFCPAEYLMELQFGLTLHAIDEESKKSETVTFQDRQLFRIAKSFGMKNENIKLPILGKLILLNLTLLIDISRVGTRGECSFLSLDLLPPGSSLLRDVESKSVTVCTPAGIAQQETHSAPEQLESHHDWGEKPDIEVEIDTKIADENGDENRNEVELNILPEDKVKLKIQEIEENSSSLSAFHCRIKAASERDVILQTGSLDSSHSNHADTSPVPETPTTHLTSDQPHVFVIRNMTSNNISQVGRCNSVVCTGSQRLSRVRAFLAYRELLHNTG